MVSLPRELALIGAAIVLHYVYQALYHKFANRPAVNSDQVGQPQETATLKTPLSQTISTSPVGNPVLASDDSQEAYLHVDTREQRAARVFESDDEEVHDGNFEHLEGFPSDPQVSSNTDWSQAYEKHLQCGPRNASGAGAWVARVNNYGEDPVGGDSWGVSITGASLLSMGRELILHGGWDDETGARSAAFTADVTDVIASRTFKPSQIPASFADGVDRTKCPGKIYGHTVTAMDSHDFLVIGGVKAGGYRAVSGCWGIFRLIRAGGQASPWQSRWLRCGCDKWARRAFHTATLVPASVAGNGQAYILLCGGSEAVVQASVLELNNVRSFPLGTDAQATCKRAGHSAALVHGTVMVMGGTDHIGPGMPWKGDDLHRIDIFDPVSREFQPMAWEPLAQVPQGALVRQHSAISVGPGLVAVFAGGLGGGGSDSMLLLNFTALNADESTGLNWVRKLSLVPLSPQCATEPKTSDATGLPVPSARLPPLRGQAATWTGSEIAVFGGSVAEREGYHGMLLLRLL